MNIPQKEADALFKGITNSADDLKENGSRSTSFNCTMYVIARALLLMCYIFLEAYREKPE